jgi:hypothetical protein
MCMMNQHRTMGWGARVGGEFPWKWMALHRQWRVCHLAERGRVFVCPGEVEQAFV